MITFEIKKDVSMSTEVESLIADCLDLNPLKAANAVAKVMAHMKSAHKAALRITAARTRKSLIESFVTNNLNWPQHQAHSNWFGKFGSVPMAPLIRANRPIKRALATTKFLRRLKGKDPYSKVKAIQPPQPYQLGGRLPRAMRYDVSDDNFEVGVTASASARNKNKMSGFQDGGTPASSNPEASRRYLAAIGIYVKKGTVLRAKPRPLIEPVAQKTQPGSMFANVYEDILADKLKIGYDD